MNNEYERGLRFCDFTATPLVIIIHSSLKYNGHYIMKYTYYKE